MLSSKKLKEEEKEEIFDQYESDCALFGKLYIEHISKHVPVKVDTLTNVSPTAFRLLDGLLGHLNEQAAERIHNVVNQQAKAAMHISSDERKLEVTVKVPIIYLLTRYTIIDDLELSLTYSPFFYRRS